MGRQNIILDKTFSFALKVIDVYNHLVADKKEYVLSKQLLRSGTSIGANVNEAVEAQSKADFIHKLSIALKEARETQYWIRLLMESGYLDSGLILLDSVSELIRILTAIIKTTKGKSND